MKSLLVDALRQAQGDVEPTAEAAVDDVGTGQTQRVRAQEETGADSLALLDVEPPESVPAGDGAAAPDAAPADTAVAACEAALDSGAAYDTLPGTLTETGVVPVTGSVPDRAAIEQCVRLAPRRYLPTVARLVPVACVVAAGIAAANYLAYEYLGRGAQRLGLPAPTLAQQPEAGGPAAAPASSPFRLVTAGASRAPALPAGVGVLPPEAPARVRGSLVAEPTGAVRRANRAAAGHDPALPGLQEAYAAWTAGDTRRAERLYRQALVVSPRHPNALQGLAATLEHDGRAAEARRVYTELLAVAPGHPAALRAMAADGSAAVAELKAAIRTRPDDAELHYALGVVHGALGRWPEARRTFARAVQLDPHNAGYLYNLAVSLEHLGRTDEAVRSYAHALEIAGDAAAFDRDAASARVAVLTDAMR